MQGIVALYEGGKKKLLLSFALLSSQSVNAFLFLVNVSSFEIIKDYIVLDLQKYSH